MPNSNTRLSRGTDSIWPRIVRSSSGVMTKTAKSKSPRMPSSDSIVVRDGKKRSWSQSVGSVLRRNSSNTASAYGSPSEEDPMKTLGLVGFIVASGWRVDELLLGQNEHAV